jgi:hypothetical protein
MGIGDYGGDGSTTGNVDVYLDSSGYLKGIDASGEKIQVVDFVGVVVYAGDTVGYEGEIVTY